MITHEEIRNLAHLARIEVTEDEIEGYITDLESILGYVKQLEQVEVSDSSVENLEINIARMDQNSHNYDDVSAEMIAHAPASEDGFYKVPKIL